MDKPDHANRDHAEFSPSSLKYVAGCAGYQGREGTSAAAEKGTRIHEALEAQDSSALHDVPISIVVGTRRRQDNGEDVNVVKSYEPQATATAAAGGMAWEPSKGAPFA